MKGRIPSAFIDELLARTDIVELINSYVPLKKIKDREYKALCPFHDEKTPSFTVSGRKQFFHCFGCAASGNAIGFLMNYANMDFLSAVDELSSMAGVEVPRDQDQTQANQPSLTHLYGIMDWCAEFYQNQLKQTQGESVAQPYLAARHVSADTIERFQIGYAPTGWDTLIKKSQKQRGLDQLAQNGLIIQKDQGGYYDRFRHRIMFPIRDPRGRVVAFGGRVLDDSTPKYLNSPETPIFSKSQVLYGLFEARRFMKDATFLLVVEGYMDVVALSQHGIHNAVATLGTAITSHHLKRLYQTTQTVIFSFDGDPAGRRAAWKALTITLPFIREGRQAQFLLLPTGEDPDTWVQKIGRDAFEHAAIHALPLSTFFFEHLSADIDLSSIDGKARLVERALPLLKQLADGVYQKMITARLVQLTGLDPSALLGNAPKKPAPRRRSQAPSTLQTSLVRTAIALLLQYPSLAEHISPAQLTAIALPGVPLLLEVVQTLHEQPDLNTAMLLEKWRGTEQENTLHKLVRLPLHISEAGVEQEFIGAIAGLLKKQQQQRLDLLLSKAKIEGLSEAEKTELNALLLTV